MRGHIRQRGKALEVRVYAGQVDGRKRYVTRTVRWQGSKKATKKAAEEELTKLLAELDGGAHTGPDASVNTLLDRWWQTHAPRWSPSTAARNESSLKAHIRPWFGTDIVRKVRTEDIDTFLAAKIPTMAPASALKLRLVLRAVFGQAVRWGWIARNPVDNAQRISVPRPDIAAPSPDDMRALLALAWKRDPDWATFIHLDAVTGARRSELCGLCWADIDGARLTLAWKRDPDWATFIHLDAVTGARRSELCGLCWADIDGPRLTIRRGIVRSTGNRYVVRSTTKSHRSRQVPLDADTVAMLKAHRTRCAQRALAAGASVGGYIFSYDVDGERPWNPNSVTQRWRRLRAKAGLDTVRLHDVRHYVATRLLDAGVPAATVAQRLGHAHEGITRSIYSHPVAESAAMAADTAAGILRGPPATVTSPR